MSKSAVWVDKMSYCSFDFDWILEAPLCYVCKAYSVKLLNLFEQKQVDKVPNCRNGWHAHYSCIFISSLSMVMSCLVITFMDEHLKIKITRLSETFIANITIKWFITCVDTHMFLKIG